MNDTHQTIGLLTIALSLALPATAAEAPRRPLPAGCPIQFKSPAVKEHIDKAYALIGKDLPQLLIPGLSLAPRLSGHCAPPGTPDYQFDDAPLPPTQAFDQLYYVGSSSVGSWVLKTDAGIIMFDAMNNPKDAQEVVEPGIRKLGLDPATIKYILITHGHGDHWGGAKYFQDKYGTKVWAGKDDAAIMKPGGRSNIEPPKVDQLITDGMELKLGSTTMHLYISPGHTMGSISAVFPVTDHGTPHTVGILGGFGLPQNIDPNPPGNSGIVAFEKSVERLKELGQKAGVDATISTHPFFDDTITKAKIVEKGRPDKSPWIIGKDGWSRFMDATEEDAKSVEAMLREHPEPVRQRPNS